jgi:DNA-binding transcriptional MerR regulator
MNNNIHATSGLLDDESAALFFNVKPRTIRLWRTTQGLPHVRVSSRVIRYRMHDLQAWMDKRCFEVKGGH